MFDVCSKLCHFPQTFLVAQSSYTWSSFRTSTKQHFSTETLDANWCVGDPSECISCFLFDLRINVGLATNVCVQSKWLFRGWMFTRFCSVDFLVPHFWAAFLALNPLSRTSFTALVKIIDRLLLCVLQLLRKGLYKIRRFPSVSAFAFRIANALLPFPLTLALFSYFCKCLLESQQSGQNR